MQTHSINISSPLRFEWQNTFISIDQKRYDQPVVISQQWQVDTLNIKSLAEWIEHPMMQSPIQLLSHYHYNHLPKSTIDLFWSRGIGVDLLQLDKAIQQTNLMNAHQLEFQWLILPPGIKIA